MWSATRLPTLLPTHKAEHSRQCSQVRHLYSTSFTSRLPTCSIHVPLFHSRDHFRHPPTVLTWTSTQVHHKMDIDKRLAMALFRIRFAQFLLPYLAFLSHDADPPLPQTTKQHGWADRRSVILQPHYCIVELVKRKHVKWHSLSPPTSHSFVFASVLESSSPPTMTKTTTIVIAVVSSQRGVLIAFFVSPVWSGRLYLPTRHSIASMGSHSTSVPIRVAYCHRQFSSTFLAL